jgi:fumarate hydratase, class I
MTIQINKPELKDKIVELIRLTSTDLPQDIIEALEKARDVEDKDSRAQNVFTMILQNIERSKTKSTPICQDTGTNIYYVHYPVGVSTIEITKLIEEATVEATEKAYLRPNTVDSLTGKNTGNNIGTLAPYIHFEEWEKEEIEIKLMLKGGGCENVSGQYKLPDTKLGAGRDLNGVYKIIIDAVNNAQGLGCAPGIIGVGIGGDRTTSMITAKEQLFRKLPDSNDNPELNTLENKLVKNLNELGIGPMGFGGKTTVLGVKMGHLHRLPASFFVSIAYMCWAHRRKTLTLKNGNYEFI